MKTTINYQKADGKWYELTCYDYSIEHEEEKLTSDNSDYAVTSLASPKSCRSCVNLLTCIQARPDVILRFQLCDEWERHDFAQSQNVVGNNFKDTKMTKDEFVTERTRIISKMLDNPDKYGIYPTTKCFNELDNLFDKITSSNSDYAKCPCCGEPWDIRRNRSCKCGAVVQCKHFA